MAYPLNLRHALIMASIIYPPDEPRGGDAVGILGGIDRMLPFVCAIVYREMPMVRVKPLAGAVCQHGTPGIWRGKLWLSRWIFVRFSDIFSVIGPNRVHPFPVQDVIYA